MASTEQYPVGTYVQLRDGIDPSFYNGFSRTGNTAWVRRRKVDNDGYIHVWIEWDKDHWSYNGAPDGWTEAGHFDILEEPVSDTSDKDRQREVVTDITKNFVDGLFEALGLNTNEPTKSENPAQEDKAQTSDDQQISTNDAIKLLQDSPA